MRSNFHSIALQSLDHLHHDGSAEKARPIVNRAPTMRDILQQAMFWKHQKREIDDIYLVSHMPRPARDYERRFLAH
jgi:hypothetical protein